MEKEFVTYEQAVALKELGFDGSCFSLYFNNGEFSNFIHAYKVNDGVVEKTNSVLAPLKQQVFRWFREKYDKLGCIKKAIDRNRFIYLVNDIVFGFYDTYEEAENALIDKLIELIKQQADGIK